MPHTGWKCQLLHMSPCIAPRHVIGVSWSCIDGIRHPKKNGIQFGRHASLEHSGTGLHALVEASLGLYFSSGRV
jgi:hypothetical protein